MPRDRKKELPEFVIHVGKRIREIRQKSNRSIAEVAYKADIDAQNLRKYELGQQEMKISMAKRIAEALNVPISKLLEQ